MATLDVLVWGRGDPFFSLTLSLSNPITWMELKHTGGQDSVWMANRRRDVGAVAARRSKNYKRRPSLRAGNSDACEHRFSPWGFVVFSLLSQWDLQVKTTSWFSRTGGDGALSVVSSLEQ
uniref:Uncharacterized protein n=1 Tax=Oryza punctata TaxID=4537 RepID=A0A0E0JR56_ORYPU